jgi:hypothetical protein
LALHAGEKSNKRLAASADLLVIGGYPPGQEIPAILRAEDVDGDSAQCCAAVPLPASDPVEGADGPLLWSRGGSGRTALLPLHNPPASGAVLEGWEGREDLCDPDLAIAESR